MIDPTKVSVNPVKQYQKAIVGFATCYLQSFQTEVDQQGYDQNAALRSVERWAKEDGFVRAPGESIREFIARATGLPVAEIETRIPQLLARCDGLRG